MATGLFPSTAAARAIAEKLGLRYAYGAYCPAFLPSSHQRPFAFPGYPHPPEVTDNAALWALNAEAMEAIFAPAWNANRARIGLAPASGIRDLVFTNRPLLAADPILAPWRPADLTDVVQTGAWILPDARPLPTDLIAFLDAGSPPVYVGYGSMPMAAAPDTAATQAGAPQVVVAQFGDQPYWAGRVAALGIGVAHEGATPTADSLSQALASALASDVRRRATETAGQTTSDGAAVAAKLIVDA